MEIAELAKEIVFYSLINSFVVFGIVSTIKKITENDNLHRFVGLSITYITGIVMGFIMHSVEFIWWQNLIYGFFIGCTSVAVYKSATQALLQVIPSIVEKFLMTEKTERYDSEDINYE